jgi:hypothetical protein
VGIVDGGEEAFGEQGLIIEEQPGFRKRMVIDLIIVVIPRDYEANSNGNCGKLDSLLHPDPQPLTIGNELDGAVL